MQRIINTIFVIDKSSTIKTCNISHFEDEAKNRVYRPQPFHPKVVKLINFQNSVILSKIDKKISKVNQVIYSLAPISVSNTKALAQILFEISCTQDFQDFFFQREIIQKGGITQKRKKIRVIFFS